jgi:SAM-dependent methyltransferase
MRSNYSSEENKQKAYYDSIAIEYDEHYFHPQALAYRYGVYDRAMGDLELDGLVALDAMCGGGQNTGYLVKRGAQVVGLDISDECCRIYSQHFPKNKVYCESILATPFPDQHFDLVVTDSLHHLHPRTDQGINEILRILKPGGHLVCWEPNAASLLNLLRRLWYKIDRRYFESNEQSIEISELKKRFGHQLDFQREYYGGSFAYMLVMTSMVFRIPTKLVNFYGPTLIKLERFLTRFQPKWLSLWVLARMQKL